eukprot:TRINITY_DN16721_c0_g1_i1.p1 TRINITY_DN16721_c0_g1~~TRINITY_DN16721_c0_g1_i1.p1  ORF type:complete len:904 (-),score=115.71 TRINITY_DN16721_c0_g1_i1:90-2756(-)
MVVRSAAICVVLSVQVFCVFWFLFAAYDIRLYPIKDFGHIIHEFDPWFNFRAAEYLSENGLEKFFKWYDYESWYPLGRPVGTTIYPGMQMTAVFIFEALNTLGDVRFQVPSPIVGVQSFATGIANMFGFPSVPPVLAEIRVVPMSVNDICCMIPCWFGASAALFTGLLAYEVSRSTNAFVATVGIMAIIPAGLMRSVGGEFDNEAVAMTSIAMTFWLWLRSVRNSASWPWSLLAALSYVKMVADWGGYIFVLNMIGLHALMLVGLGRFNVGVHKSYTIFWVFGTIGAIQIPVVGMQPLRSLEQMGPLLVCAGYQVLAFCDSQRRSRSMAVDEFVKFRIRTFVCFGACLACIAISLWPMGYFGPLSARIRGLFVKHTKTGNPLVDSVAEHQPADVSMYKSYLSMPLDYAYWGMFLCLHKRNNAFYFMVLYGFIAEHFSGKMSRLVLICAPITSVAAGLFCGWLLDRIQDPFFLLLGRPSVFGPAIPNTEDGSTSGKDGNQSSSVKSNSKAKDAARDSGNKDGKNKSKKKGGGAPKAKYKWEKSEWEDEERPGGAAQMKREFKALLWSEMSEEQETSINESLRYVDTDERALLIRAGISVFVVFVLLFGSPFPARIYQFVSHCDRVAQSLSNPQVVYSVNGKNGPIIIDDYLKGYQWIDANTPKDSRVMAWWDYGYQITGIARRTSIADGNTWNHEHIATLGRTLTSPEKKAWNAIRHLADYVLVWAGGGGDDLAKSPHLARIGNSVFPDHCGDDDPKCNKFSFYGDGSPTPMMARSLLYKLVSHNVKPGVKVSQSFFKEVHTTKYGLMRVYKVMNISQTSKDWIADPANRICDAPGSWYCVGQYPPAIKDLISKRRNFAQVEDFNKQGAKSAYTKMIEQELAGKKKSDL